MTIDAASADALSSGTGVAAPSNVFSNPGIDFNQGAIGIGGGQVNPVRDTGASITSMPDTSGYPSGVPGGLGSDFFNGGGARGVETAGHDIQKTGQAADTTLTTNTQSAEKTGTGCLQYVGNLTYDIVPRIGGGKPCRGGRCALTLRGRIGVGDVRVIGEVG